MTRRVIGTLAHCRGDEHPYLRGTELRIAAVLRGEETLGTDDEIGAARGIQAGDRVEVVPRIEAAGRFSGVTSDPLAADLVVEGKEDGV